MTYRPLVAYCVFGQSYARMLNISLWSLFDVGAYQGDILIVTDMTRDVLAQHCPLIVWRRVIVIRVELQIHRTAKLSRYQLHRCFDTASYAPILYVDCDIVFDRPLAPILAAVASADRLCFPAELQSSADWHSMGGDLLRDEGIEPPARCGFNSGTLGIPHGAEFRFFAQLERIASTAEQLWDGKPHLFTRWFDQPVVNYLQSKYGLFDTAALTPFFRFFFANSEVSSAYESRHGGAHFFDDDKEARMSSYLEAVSPTAFFDVNVASAVEPFRDALPMRTVAASASPVGSVLHAAAKSA